MISFKSKVALKLMSYYFVNPAAGHYVNELARNLELDPKNLYRKLRELEKEGILYSEFRGKERYFYLNKKYPLLSHYREIFKKTLGVEKQLKEIVRDTKGIKEAYIFGSYARGGMDSSSDIDVLAIGGHSVLELQKRINCLQRETGREFNVVNLSEAEYADKKKKKDQFLKNVFSGKVIKL